MDDLISRQAAINAIDEISREVDDGDGFDYAKWREYFCELPSAQPEPIKINIEDFNKEDWERFRKEWANTPITVLPAQPEIIRCKDCKYAEYIDDVQTLWCTECGQGRTVAPDDFCSYAERRTE